MRGRNDAPNGDELPKKMSDLDRSVPLRRSATMRPEVDGVAYYLSATDESPETTHFYVVRDEKNESKCVGVSSRVGEFDARPSNGLRRMLCIFHWICWSDVQKRIGFVKFIYPFKKYTQGIAIEDAISFSRP